MEKGCWSCTLKSILAPRLSCALPEIFLCCLSPRAAVLNFRSDEVNALRMGFQESNQAHQRTAQRSQGFEKELEISRRTVETLKVDKASFKEQVQLTKYSYLIVQLDYYMTNVRGGRLPLS